ncbi:hypothetical protein, conserved in T. vivax [Trypanosoma vivax Y486]|uniref:Uncharacterized protein n=1 Tax=Trypanosoma vivax (strain Y486) TaxID=1055687 RepID=F9WV36_TRYVY|nr:hypothetical protein, conserved in T. vivax [Trypanosoma vivax Y486]|eukprot:CCD21440.1 hypothetical protein, conserved in T. vivax [Trypanosoma vivax Y486]
MEMKDGDEENRGEEVVLMRPKCSNVCGPRHALKDEAADHSLVVGCVCNALGKVTEVEFLSKMWRADRCERALRRVNIALFGLDESFELRVWPKVSCRVFGCLVLGWGVVWREKWRSIKNADGRFRRPCMCGGHGSTDISWCLPSRCM